MTTGIGLLSVGLFSPGQIAGIVIVSILVAGLIGLNIWLGYLLHKRGAHKLHTAQLRMQREALMEKLAAMRAGGPVESSGVKFVPVFAAVGDAADQDDEEEEEQAKPSDEADVEEEDDNESLDLEVTAEGNVVRYNRSFSARIIQSDNDLKARYSELKNYILSYKGVRARMSWQKETFHAGRKNIASFIVRGKTLCVCLATDAKLFDGTKYKVEDMSLRSKKNPMPCRFRITSDRKTGYAKELVDIVMAGFGVDRVLTYAPQDYTLPYKSTEALVKRRLIKVVGDSIPDFAKEDALAAAKRIRYNRSFEARIIQCDDELKGYYSTLKNYILAHNGVTAVNTWKKETFTADKNTLATFIIRGKTLCLCLALDPAQFDGTKYKVEDLSGRVKKTKTPCLYRVKSARRISYAMHLIDVLCGGLGIEKTERESVNYAVPFVATETLVRRGLIKVVKLPKKKGEGGDPDDTTDAATQPAETESDASIEDNKAGEPLAEAAATDAE